jgi:hypothetical protein
MFKDCWPGERRYEIFRFQTQKKETARFSLADFIAVATSLKKTQNRLKSP